MSAPTGSPGPYGPSGQPAQPDRPVQPGQPAQPAPPVQPGPPYAMQLAPAPVPPRSNTPLVIVAVLLGVAVVFAGTYLVGRLTAPPAPSAASSVATPASHRSGSASTTTVQRAGFTLNGSTLSGPGFAARMPSGWALAADNGSSDTDGVIENGSDNSIAYFATDPTSAVTRCHNAFESYRVKLGGTVVDLPNVRWANGTAVVKELETKYSTGQEIGLNIYCVDRPGNTSAAILSIAARNHQATNKAAAEALLGSWTWT
jgi:hypothetical protein